MRYGTYLADILRNRVGMRTHPRFLTYIVTFICNARCVMCDSWRKPSPDELTTAELDQLFGQLGTMDAVRLSGGEPFIRQDLGEIVELAQRRLAPLVLHITTNGFLTDRIVSLCEQRDRRVPLRIMVSLDGTSAKHNAIRGRDTAFESAMATLKALAPRRVDLNLHLSVKQTILDADGLEEYRRLRPVLAPLGIKNHPVLAYAASATYNLKTDVDLAASFSKEYPLFQRINHTDLDAFLGEVDHDTADLPRGERATRRYYLVGLREWLRTGTRPFNPPCVALNSHLRLMPNGDIPTCQFNSRIIGNIRSTSFQELWKSPGADEQRRWVRNCKGCWAECEVVPNALYSGDILRTLGSASPVSPQSTEGSEYPECRSRPMQPPTRVGVPDR